MNYGHYIVIGQALVKLLHPLVEVVIHDLQSDTIVFIEGNLSKRKEGDPSLLKNDIHLQNEQLYNESYSKLSFDGKLIKSISIPLKEKECVKGLFCINYDISLFTELKIISGQFFKNENTQPSVLFKNDWQEKMHVYVYGILKEKKLKIETLNTKEKRELIKLLHKAGFFSEKNAADYVADILDMSRATVFNCLRRLRETI